jgi:hypothetical protein
MNGERNEIMEKKEVLILNEYERIVPNIVSDPLIATVNAADGKFVPLLIIDTSNRPDIENLMEIHSRLGEGDVQSNWFQNPKQKLSLGLFMNFLKPTPCRIILEFDLLTRSGLVDCIVRAQGLYIQCGRDGDRYISTMNHNKILIEVPSKEFQKKWDSLFQESCETKFRKQGLSRKEARVSAKAFIT